MKILVIGAGYVGLVTGACFADKGNHVICVERDEKKYTQLCTGVLPIYEPGLEELVKSTTSKGTLFFANCLEEALTETPSDSIKRPLLIFIAVGTPQGEDGSADLKYVIDVASEIGQQLQEPAIVVIKSTVPVGTSELVKGEIAWQLFQRKKFIDFDVVSNPEFLKEGIALNDFFNPDRIVIGSESRAAVAQLSCLYEPFIKRPSQLVIVGVKESELVKYASNAMLATRVSFINEIALLCDRLGVNIDQVSDGVGSDMRIGPSFLRAGCGYGGSCFPKDVQALVRIAQSVGVEPFVMSAVEKRNQQQKQYLFQKIKTRFSDNLQDMQFAVWGLAFKPNTDDMREAPSIELIHALTAAGAKVVAHDPIAWNNARNVFIDLIQVGKLHIAPDAITAVQGADALLILTEWDEYKIADFAAVKAALKFPLIFDGRNHLPITKLKTLGFEYVGIGRN